MSRRVRPVDCHQRNERTPGLNCKVADVWLQLVLEEVISLAVHILCPPCTCLHVMFNRYMIIYFLSIVSLSRLRFWPRWRSEHILWPIYAEIHLVQKVSHSFSCNCKCGNLPLLNISVAQWRKKWIMHMLSLFIMQFVNVGKNMRQKWMQSLFVRSIVSKRRQWVYMKSKSERAGGVVDLRSASGIMLHQLGLTTWGRSSIHAQPLSVQCSSTHAPIQWVAEPLEV